MPKPSASAFPQWDPYAWKSARLPIRVWIVTVGSLLAAALWTVLFIGTWAVFTFLDAPPMGIVITATLALVGAAVIASGLALCISIDLMRTGPRGTRCAGLIAVPAHVASFVSVALTLASEEYTLNQILAALTMFVVPIVLMGAAGIATLLTARRARERWGTCKDAEGAGAQDSGTVSMK